MKALPEAEPAYSFPCPAWALPLYEARNPNPRYKVSWGGRGGGKTRFHVADLLDLITWEPEPVIGVLARAFKSHTRLSVGQAVKDVVRDNQWQAYWDTSGKEIFTSRVNGSEVYLMGVERQVNGGSTRTLENVKYFHGAEWQGVSRATMDELRPSVRAPGSMFSFDFNPDSTDDWVYDRFITHPQPEDVIAEAQYWQNPWFPEVLELERQTDLRLLEPDRYAHVWLGRTTPVSREDRLIYRRGVHWDHAAYDPDLYDHLPPLLGADFGKADPTALVEVRVDAEHHVLRIGRMDYKTGLRLRDIRERWPRIPTALTHQIRGDSAAAQIIHSLRDTFPKIVGAIKGPNSVAQGIRFLQDWTMLVDPRLTDLTYELNRYGYKIDPRTDLVTNIIEDRDNHALDAIRYAVELLRIRGVSPSTVAVPEVVDV